MSGYGRGGVPPELQQLATRPPKTAHFCGLRCQTKSNALRGSCSLASVSDALLSLRDRDNALLRVSFFLRYREAPLRLQVRLRSLPGALRAAGDAHPSARTLQAPGWAPTGWSAGTRTLRVFILKKKPQRLAILSSRARATFPSRPRRTSRVHMLRGASPSRQWVRRWPGSRPQPSAPAQDPRGAEHGCKGGRRGVRRGRTQWGRWAPPPWDRKLAPGAGRRGGGGGQLGRPARSPAPDRRRRALTSTVANRSSSSPGSGIGSFKGTLCALKSVCCESILPALPMLAARWGRGLLRAPRVRVRNQNSSGRQAARPLARPAGLPALRCAPVTVPHAPLPSSARSRAAPRPPSCSSPPQCRPGLFSSGGVVRARGAYLHVVPLARCSLPAITDSGRVVPPTQSPTRAAANTDTSNPPPPSTTLAARAPLADKCSSALPTQCPLSPAPGPRSPPSSSRPPARLRPLAPRTVGKRSFWPKRPHAETTPASSEGPCWGKPASGEGNLYPSRGSLCQFCLTSLQQ